MLNKTRMDEGGEDIREILSGDEREIAVAIISSWNGDGEPAMVAERTNENTRKERAEWADDTVGGQCELGRMILL